MKCVEHLVSGDKDVMKDADGIHKGLNAFITFVHSWSEHVCVSVCHISNSSTTP